MIPVFALATWGWTSPNDAHAAAGAPHSQAPEVAAHPSSTLARPVNERGWPHIEAACVNELGRLNGGVR